MRSRAVIAIDGPAGAGKSTAARALAKRLGYRFLDSGALYRAVTLRALRAGLDFSDEEAVARVAAESEVVLRESADGLRVLLDGEDVSAEIRGPDVTASVSVVAALPRVRAAVVPLQRAFAEGGGVVAEGRDIGTVVFPDADVKFWLDADPETRARRRAGERGEEDVARVAREIAERDRRDRLRAVAPLVPAPGAVRLDTTGLEPEEVVDLLERKVRHAGHGVL